MTIYVDARCVPSDYRGHNRIDSIILTNWNCVSKEHLDFLKYQILYPFCQNIILATPLIEALS
jgi:hypothetical protein